MKKIAAMVLITLFYFHMPVIADPGGKYRPVKFELSYAEEIILSENLHDLIKQKLQECIDNEVRWSPDQSKVNLSIKIIHLDVASSAEIMSARLTSSNLPDSKISGEVTIISGGKPVKKYEVTVNDKIYWPFKKFVDARKNIVEKFANQIMDSLAGE